MGELTRVRLHVHTPLAGVQTVRGESALLAKELDLRRMGGAHVAAHLVNKLRATIVAGTRKPLGILVRQARAEAVHHGTRGEVLSTVVRYARRTSDAMSSSPFH